MSHKGEGPGSGRRPRRVRQSDVARAAGVSQATVSLVLNNTELSIASSTRQAVIDAAQRLGYVPDPVAQRLASGRNFLIGLHTFAARFPVNLTDSYYPYLEGAEVEAAAQGFDLLLFTGSGRTNTVPRLQLADGSVLVGRHPKLEEIEALLDADYPVVYIGRHDELGDRLPYVGADYAAAAEELVERLWELGHRGIVYVQGPDTAVASRDREEGFRRAIAAHEGALRGTALRIEVDEISTGMLRSWLDDGITSVIVEGGTDAPGALPRVMRAIRELSLVVPRDLSVATTGVTPVTWGGDGAFAGFVSPRHEMGRQAVRLLVRLLSGEEPEPAERQMLLSCEPLIGDTAGPPPR